MFNTALKKALLLQEQETAALAHRQLRKKYLRELVYDAVCFAEEESFRHKKRFGIEFTGAEKRSVAVSQVMKADPIFTSVDEIEDCITSIMGKLQGAGASGRVKL